MSAQVQVVMHVLDVIKRLLCDAIQNTNTHLYEFVSTKRIEFVVCGYGLVTKNNQNKKVFDSILKKINALFLMNLAVSIR